MARVFVYDEFNPEDVAMMQALYSRSPQSVTEHVQKVRESGSGKFMEKFYVGYGHMSIADCGSTTLFIEGISILADKAVQDWQLYSGQETSTRYIDMSKQPIIDPIGTEKSKMILDEWMNFYVSSQERMNGHLSEKYPKKDGENQDFYNKAIKARTFDVLRAFLPAGITTQLSWHTNLRQAWDKLSWMRHHPLKEVKELSETILSGLKDKYPHSFSHEMAENQERYREYVTSQHNYFNSSEIVDFSMKTEIDAGELKKYKDILFWRPEKTGLPGFLAELGNITFDFILDFGSFRDIQRHRNGICRMPLLTVEKGFNSWYLEQLPDDLRKKAEELIAEQINSVNSLETSLEIRQYYIAMGFNVSCQATYGLPAAVYVAELRSGKMVHPTLRKIARKMTLALLEKFPFLKLQSDLLPDTWDCQRGNQDIVAK